LKLSVGRGRPPGRLAARHSGRPEQAEETETERRIYESQKEQPMKLVRWIKAHEFRDLLSSLALIISISTLFLNYLITKSVVRYQVQLSSQAQQENTRRQIDLGLQAQEVKQQRLSLQMLASAMDRLHDIFIASKEMVQEESQLPDPHDTAKVAKFVADMDARVRTFGIIDELYKNIDRVYDNGAYLRLDSKTRAVLDSIKSFSKAQPGASAPLSYRLFVVIKDTDVAEKLRMVEEKL
jgi:hypothetical protein